MHVLGAAGSYIWKQTVVCSSQHPIHLEVDGYESERSNASNVDNRGAVQNLAVFPSVTSILYSFTSVFTTVQSSRRMKPYCRVQMIQECL